MKLIATTIQPALTPPPTSVPRPLPRTLLPDLVRRNKLLLCLDYDGTLSEITGRPADARPVLFARRVLAALATHHERIVVAIISGRDIDTLRRQLEIDRGLVLVGNHGLEYVDRDGHRHLVAGIENFQPNLEMVRDWMSKEIPRRSGFVIEDKRLTIALHYRNANPPAATAIRASLRKFLDRECPNLRILAGNKVDEVIPRDIGGKGSAVRRLLDSKLERDRVAVYIGDDVTDEDAFFALRDEGVTVRVGALQRSWARYRVNGPSDVVAALGDLVAALPG